MEILNKVNRERRRFSPILILLLGLFLYMILPATGEAQEGIPCVEEPMMIEYGDLVICQIETVFDSDLFHFLGNSSERVVVQVSRQSGPGSPCFQLFDPDGLPLHPFCVARVDRTLNTPGIHTIRVVDNGNNQTVDYALALDRLAPEPSRNARSICFTACLLEDEINPVGDPDLFFFEGSSEDRVIVEVFQQGGAGSPCFQLFDPDGLPLHPFCVARVDRTLNTPGIHTIRVVDNGDNQTVNYALKVDCIAGPCLSFADRVRILTAGFFNPLNLLFVAATSSTAPDAQLSVTVPGCADSAQMEFRPVNETYALLRSCPGLGSETATVTSSHGGSASAPIDFLDQIP